MKVSRIGVVLRLTMLLAISGCARDQFYIPPQLMAVHFTVRWATQEEVRRACRDPAAVACITKWATAADPRAEIMLQLAENWDDWPKICSAGHEFYHGLGARHQKRDGAGVMVLP